MRAPLVVAALILLAAIPRSAPRASGADGDALTLIVGQRDHMKTRNPLPDTADDMWTQDVLERVYDRPLKVLPNGTLLAYVAKGVDVDGDRTFEASEYDRWTSVPPGDLDVTVYYDFNGVEWHDGTPMTVWDVLFSYHVAAMNARFNTDLRVLYCTSLESASYEGCGRQLSMEVHDADGNPANGYQKNWQNEGGMAGDPAKRVAIRYRLNQPFALFYESTLFPVMMPMHVWSRTGGGRHASSDFGCAVWIPPTEAADRGIPACGNTNAAKWGDGIASTDTVPGSSPYQYTRAEQWNVQDADVIGNGPFEFDTWSSGIEAKVVRYERYYTGVDPDDPSIVYDPQLAQVLKKPTIDGIRFKVFSTTQLGVFALQNGDIDYYHWNVGADFVADLLKVPEIAVEANAEPGFFYMAYNLRRTPWGYVNGDPAQGDVGIGFRDAVSHLVDKKSIVQNLLGNFGVIGHGVISPANTFWYNDNIPKPDYSLSAARAVLDDLASSTDGGRFYVPGYSTDPPGACDKDFPTRCRSIGSRGNALFEILTPQADYDPVRATAGANVAADMRAVGINAVSRPMAFGEIVNRINAHNFDLYILGWRVGGTDPDYLFSFFHSSNAGVNGQNYPGYNNRTFDSLITRSRAELDRNARQGFVFDAQRQLAIDRPYEVLYYRTNIEGYRQDRFVNWTVSSGTIWGYWSLEGIRPPSARALRPSISAESATRSGARETVTVTVFDHENNALADANVTFSVAAENDQGNVSIGTGPEAKSVFGFTDLNGQVRATHTAAVVDRETQVVIDVVASHPEFPDPSARSAVVRVFPLGTAFLSTRADRPLGDRLDRGTQLPLSITVSTLTDQGRITVSDAVVTVFITRPSGAFIGDLTADPATGNASELVSVTLTARSNATAGDYEVSVTADLIGYESPPTTPFLITVVGPTTGPHRCPDGRYVNDPSECVGPSTPALDVVFILAAIGLTALVVGVVAQRKRRS